MKQSDMLFRLSACLLFLLSLMASSAYGGTCTNTAGKEADIKYNSDYHTYQFCNGTSWIAYGGGGGCAGSGGYSPTTPAGSGYFVMSKTRWTGNLGTGLAGADALCLTELTTNTGWRGYAAAN